MEKIEKCLNLFKVWRQPEWGKGWGSLGWDWSMIDDDRNICRQASIQWDTDKVTYRILLENAETSLNNFKEYLLSIVNECNCEERNNQQLVLVRSSNESNLNIIKKEREGLQSLVRVGERELNKKNSQIEEKDRQIARRDEQIREKEGQLTISREEARRVTELFNNLQIESSNKDNQINQKAEELKQKEKEIIKLKAQLGTLSPEEVLKRKIAFGEKELDDTVRSLSLNYQTIMNLCDAHERYELAQREGNRDDKNNARNNIRNIKQELFAFATQNNISNDELHKKIYQSCEELAKLRVELEVLKENQYQVRQEVPTYGCNQQ